MTNIDEEHLDHWHGGIAEIEEAFIDFVNKVPFYGCAVMCLDHPRVQSILPKIERKIWTYGLSPQADYVASNVVSREDGTEFTVKRHGEELGRVELAMIGTHNVQTLLPRFRSQMRLESSFHRFRRPLLNLKALVVVSKKRGVLVMWL